MVTLSDARIDELIAEDVPYIDLTSHILGIDAQAGAMEYFTREACVLAGGEVASRIATKLGCVVTNILPDGTALEAGQSFMTIGGTAAQLHQAWKVCLNVFDHLSAVATKTRAMVDAAHAASPSCEVLTTRKSMPGVKDLLVEATIAGGAFPHRLACPRPYSYSTITSRSWEESTSSSNSYPKSVHAASRRSCSSR